MCDMIYNFSNHSVISINIIYNNIFKYNHLWMLTCVTLHTFKMIQSREFNFFLLLKVVDQSEVKMTCLLFVREDTFSTVSIHLS